MIERAAAARFEALVLTVDTAVLGRRERDVRRGFSLPPTIGPRTFIDGALHPAWTWAFVRSEPIRFANVVGRDVGDGASPVNAVRLHQHPVRPGAVVARRRLAALGVGRPDRHQGHPDRRGRRARRGRGRRRDRAVEPRRPPARRRARRRSRSSRRLPTRSAAASRSSATAACGAAATSSRPSPPAQPPAWPAARISTRSARAANAASTACLGWFRDDLERTMSLVGAPSVAALLTAPPSRPLTPSPFFFSYA